MTITYQAQTQTIHLVFVDGSQVIDDVPVSGLTGETVDLPLTTIDQTKYEITGTVPNQHVMVANDDTVITVNLVHRTQTSSETRTVTRTIVVNLPSGSITIPQVATSKRTKTTDLVTGQATYGPWSTDQWASYDAPAVDGYSASPQRVASVEVTGDTQDQTITIDYQVIAKPTNATEQTTPVPQAVPAAVTQATSTSSQQATLLQTGDDSPTALIAAGLALGSAQLALLGIRKKQRN